MVYFSLAALPLFGIGQLFIPKDDLAARQYAFRLLFIYTASGLGLLLSTSFLGLRRYLRQRRQEMPLAMVNLWLGIGAALIVGVMFAAMLLPRPNAEYSISEPPIRIGSPDQHASPYGTGSEGVEEEQPDARPEPSEKANPDSPTSNEPGKSKKSGEGKDGKKRADSNESAKKSGEKGEKSEDAGKSLSSGDQAKDQDKIRTTITTRDRSRGIGESEKKSKPSEGSGGSRAKTVGENDASARRRR